MTHRELNGKTGLWKGLPAVIASDGDGNSLYILQNHTDGADCSSRLKALYPQFRYSYSMCIPYRSDCPIGSDDLSGFILDPIQDMLTWKSVKKFNL